MGVVTKYAKSYKDPSSIALPEPVFAEGMTRCISTGPFAVANGDSISSKHYLGKIPSNAVPVIGGSTLFHGANTSVNDYDIGVELNGTVIDADLFADGIDISSAGTKSVFASIAAADVGKRVWELLGLAVDPGVEYDIVGTMKVAATGNATNSAQINYAKK